MKALNTALKQESALELIQLSVLFDASDTPALRQISFSIPRSAKIACIGPTSSGKSVLLKTIGE